MTTAAWTARIITLYPEMFPGPLGVSLAGRALAEKIWSLEVHNLRSYAKDRHGSVDDSPAGGGPGMILRADILGRAIDAITADEPAKSQPIVCLSPRGRRFNQEMAKKFAKSGGFTLICGRFEGIDERVISSRGIEELSVGDFVLSGGEPAALVIMDAVVRLLPGVVGSADVLKEESFDRGLLEYPQYTRPQVWEDKEIPEVLTSGHHEKIRAWRQAEAERITRERRPDLWRRFQEDRDQTKD